MPQDLIPVYLLPQPVTLLNPEYLSSLVVLILIVWSLNSFRKNPWYVWAWGFYFISIFFLLRFDDHAYGNPVQTVYVFRKLRVLFLYRTLADHGIRGYSKTRRFWSLS